MYSVFDCVVEDLVKNIPDKLEDLIKVDPISAIKGKHIHNIIDALGSRPLLKIEREISKSIQRNGLSFFKDEIEDATVYLSNLKSLTKLLLQILTEARPQEVKASSLGLNKFTAGCLSMYGAITEGIARGFSPVRCDDVEDPAGASEFILRLLNFYGLVMGVKNVEAAFSSLDLDKNVYYYERLSSIALIDAFAGSRNDNRYKRRSRNRLMLDFVSRRFLLIYGPDIAASIIHFMLAFDPCRKEYKAWTGMLNMR